MMNLPHEIISPSPVNLPDELIAEVLSWFNVESVMQLKCVSKSWNSIISDPFFVRMHQKKSSRIPYIILISSHKFNNSTFVYPISILENPPIDIFTKNSEYRLIEYCRHIRVIGSCNGLICSLNSRENKFYLRNPATTILHENSASFLLPFDYSDFAFKLSFGYDNLTNKYKLVAFSSEEVRVFTFGDNVWKNIVFFPVYPYSSIRNSGVYLSNSLNWFALLDNNDFYSKNNLSIEQFVIISLDLGTETYTQFEFPREFDEVPFPPPVVCNLMDCLCFYHHTKELSFVIWQMKEFGVDKSWTKLLKFDYHSLFDCSMIRQLLPLHVFENGDILISVSIEGQLIRYSRKRNVGQLIPYRRDMNNISMGDVNNINMSTVIPYVESLVSTF